MRKARANINTDRYPTSDRQHHSLYSGNASPRTHHPSGDSDDEFIPSMQQVNPTASQPTTTMKRKPGESFQSSDVQGSPSTKHHQQALPEDNEVEYVGTVQQKSNRLKLKRLSALHTILNAKNSVVETPPVQPKPAQLDTFRTQHSPSTPLRPSNSVQVHPSTANNNPPEENPQPSSSSSSPTNHLPLNDLGHITAPLYMEVFGPTLTVKISQTLFSSAEKQVPTPSNLTPPSGSASNPRTTTAIREQFSTIGDNQRKGDIASTPSRPSL